MKITINSTRVRYITVPVTSRRGGRFNRFEGNGEGKFKRNLLAPTGRRGGRPTRGARNEKTLL